MVYKPPCNDSLLIRLNNKKTTDINPKVLTRLFDFL